MLVDMSEEPTAEAASTDRPSRRERWAARRQAHDVQQAVDRKRASAAKGGKGKGGKASAKGKGGKASAKGKGGKGNTLGGSSPREKLPPDSDRRSL